MLLPVPAIAAVKRFNIVAFKRKRTDRDKTIGTVLPVRNKSIHYAKSDDPYGNSEEYPRSIFYKPD